MNCEHAVDLLTGAVDDATAAARRQAQEHVASCSDCRDAVVSVHALRLSSLAPVAKPQPDAFARAMSRAVGPAAAQSRPTRGPFWLGMGVGAALAASLAIAIVALLLVSPTANENAGSGSPALELAVNQPQNVSISLTTAQALADAEIHVTLSGSIDLDGFAGQRELSWHTNLDAGINQLTLPIVATGATGGQVLVEVAHGGKTRQFVVDVKAQV